MAAIPSRHLPNKPLLFKCYPQSTSVNYIHFAGSRDSGWGSARGLPGISDSTQCRQDMFCAVTPKVSQTRRPSGPTSTVTTLWCGPTAKAEIKRDFPLPSSPPPGDRRLTHWTANGKHARTARKTPTETNEDSVIASHQLLLTRRNRSDGVTTSVKRIPNLSLTTTTSPCAIKYPFTNTSIGSPAKASSSTTEPCPS